MKVAPQLDKEKKMRKFYLLRLADGYSVLEDSESSLSDSLISVSTINELIEYLNLREVTREEVDFIEASENDFSPEVKSKILQNLPLSIMK